MEGAKWLRRGGGDRPSSAIPRAHQKMRYNLDEEKSERGKYEHRGEWGGGVKNGKE